MVAAQQVEILEAFIEYLKQQNRIDFLANEKSGLFFISRVNTADNCIHEAVQIQSTEHLCDVLMTAFMDDYMSELQIMCLEQIDIVQLFQKLEPYLNKLPQYRTMLQDAILQATSMCICNSETE